MTEPRLHTWDYRLVRTKDWIGLYEVYYYEDGRPAARSSTPAAFVGADVDAFENSLRHALEGCAKPILDDKIFFTDGDD